MKNKRKVVYFRKLYCILGVKVSVFNFGKWINKKMVFNVNLIMKGLVNWFVVIYSIFGKYFKYIEYLNS